MPGSTGTARRFMGTVESGYQARESSGHPEVHLAIVVRADSRLAEFEQSR